MNIAAPLPTPLDVIIVGAGISGIGMAAHRASGKALCASCSGRASLLARPSTRSGTMWSAPRAAANRAISSLTNWLARARGEQMVRSLREAAR